MITNNNLPQMNLTDEQLNDLARPLVSILMEFYKDPENEKKFQEWLQRQAIEPTISIK